MQGNGGIYDNEFELYFGLRCNIIYVDFIVSFQFGVIGYGFECESFFFIEKVEKKVRDQDF